MPEISVVNLKDERQKQKEENSNLPYWLSKPLYEKLVEGFQKGEQSALFLNRRGVAQSVFCPSCGTNYECPNCSISLTLHGSTYLVCHYCEYREEFNFKCKECSSNEIGPLGVGTEKVEQDLRILFPEMKISRADRDEIQNRSDMEELIFSFEKREIDLLIGTQMIAKGLDFPGLTTVGLVLTDVGFHLPDFRATERSFQLIVQVAGRAGRHSELPGQVVIQTYDPKHPSITYGLKNDFLNFADNELSMRKALMYPPFGRLACFKISGLNLSEVENGANALKYRINTLLESTSNYSDFRILGPAPSPISKLRGNYRFQILVKSPDNQLMSAFCNQIMNNKKWMPKKIKIHLDVDPVNLL